MAVTLDSQPDQADPFREIWCIPCTGNFLTIGAVCRHPKVSRAAAIWNQLIILGCCLGSCCWILQEPFTIGGFVSAFSYPPYGDTGVAECSGADSTGRWLDEAVTQPQL